MESRRATLVEKEGWIPEEFDWNAWRTSVAQGLSPSERRVLHQRQRERILDVGKRHGWSREELGAVFQVECSTISRWKRPRKTVSRASNKPSPPVPVHSPASPSNRMKEVLAPPVPLALSSDPPPPSIETEQESTMSSFEEGCESPHGNVEGEATLFPVDRSIWKEKQRLLPSEGVHFLELPCNKEAKALPEDIRDRQMVVAFDSSVDGGRVPKGNQLFDLQAANFKCILPNEKKTYLLRDPSTGELVGAVLGQALPEHRFTPELSSAITKETHVRRPSNRSNRKGIVGPMVTSGPSVDFTNKRVNLYIPEGAKAAPHVVRDCGVGWWKRFEFDVQRCIIIYKRYRMCWAQTQRNPLDSPSSQPVGFHRELIWTIWTSASGACVWC
jgi:hypothetical protein